MMFNAVTILAVVGLVTAAPANLAFAPTTITLPAQPAAASSTSETTPAVAASPTSDTVAAPVSASSSSTPVAASSTSEIILAVVASPTLNVVAAPVSASSSSTPVAASTSTTAAAAATAPTCEYKLENSPWIVRRLKAFTAAPGTDGPSYVSFHLQDTNPGLELSITCSRTLAKQSTDSVEDPNNYYLCSDTDVQFMYDGKTVTIERTYEDPCLGEWPYDSTTVWGQASTSMQNKTMPVGNMASQTQMQVHVTEEFS